MRFPLPQLFSVATAVALLAGAVAVQALTALPSLWLTIPVVIAGLILASRHSRWRC